MRIAQFANVILFAGIRRSAGLPDRRKRSPLLAPPRWPGGTRAHRPRAFRLTAAAAGCLAIAHGIFWSVVQPVNVEMMRWPLDAIPPDWTTWRDRWEYGHAARAGLVTAALGALTWSVLADAVDDRPDAIDDMDGKRTTPGDGGLERFTSS